MGETAKAKVKMKVGLKAKTKAKTKVKVKSIEQATPVVSKQQAVRRPVQTPTNKDIDKQLVLGLGAATPLVAKRFGYQEVVEERKCLLGGKW